MKTLRTFTRIATLATLLLLFIAVAPAQDSGTATVITPPPVHSVQEKTYRLQFLAGYVNSEVRNPIEAVQNIRTLNVDGKINAINKSGWTFGPAFNYQRAYDVEVMPDSEIYPNGLYRDVDTYFGGAEVAKKAGPFNFGGGFFLGTRQIHPDVPRQFVRKYRGFVEIGLSHFIVRPFFAEAELAGGFGGNRVTRYGAAGGFRF